MIKVGLIDMKWGAIPVIKYKLYTFSGAVYVVPIDKYEYVDDIAETYKQIMDLAIRTRSEFKEDAKELRRNKLA